MQSITILGATGSIGQSTLDVISQHPDRYRVFALSGFNNLDLLAQQTIRFQPTLVVVPDEVSRIKFLKMLGNDTIPEVLIGVDGLVQISKDPAVDTVMAAIVGAAGMLPTLEAIRSNKKVLLANKESLVAAGKLMMEKLRNSSSILLPVDSEHNAIFQCLPDDYDFKSKDQGIESILLTASGGPFRDFTTEELQQVTPEQACDHPNWNMGKKISVDSATLMNKGLELIEACWLFDVRPSDIEVVIHPQSIIHSMVRYADGSVLAQLGSPDMKTPISYSLSWPSRHGSGAKPLDFKTLTSLTFDTPDETKFPCLKLAKEAFNAGGNAGALLNAANEVSVESFLRNEIAFLDIPRINEQVLNDLECTELNSIDDVINSDFMARQFAKDRISQLRRY